MSQDVGINCAMLGETKHAKILINPRMREGRSRTRPGHQGLALTSLGSSIGGYSFLWAHRFRYVKIGCLLYAKITKFVERWSIRAWLSLCTFDFTWGTGQLDFWMHLFPWKHSYLSGFKRYFHHKATVFIIFLLNEISSPILLGLLKTPPSSVYRGLQAFLPRGSTRAPYSHVISRVDKPELFPHQAHSGLQQCGHWETPITFSLPTTCAGDVIINHFHPYLILAMEVKPATPPVGSRHKRWGVSPASAGALSCFAKPPAWSFLQELFLNWEDWGPLVLPSNRTSLTVKQKPRFLTPLPPAWLSCHPHASAPSCPFPFVFWRWAFKLLSMCWRYAY